MRKETRRLPPGFLGAWIRRKHDQWWYDDQQRRPSLEKLPQNQMACVFLRAVNIYGDPNRWSVQSSKVLTILSFLNCTKYPRSLPFLLMTLGPALIAMAWLERKQLAATNLLIVFGRVPFFFFVIHLAVIHVVAIFLGYLRYGWTSFLLLPPPSMGSMRDTFPPGYGNDLWVVYVVWIA
jgi:hypothetical protein